MTNTKTLYEKIGKIIVDLRACNQIAIATQLEDAMRISMHPGEILGAICSCLRSLAASEAQFPKNLHVDASECIAYIDTVYPPRSDV